MKTEKEIRAEMEKIKTLRDSYKYNSSNWYIFNAQYIILEWVLHPRP